jgi:hypothetical protein
MNRRLMLATALAFATLVPIAELGTASAQVTIGPGGVRIGQRCERVRTCRVVGGGERRVCRTEIDRRGRSVEVCRERGGRPREVCTTERRCR